MGNYGTAFYRAPEIFNEEAYPYDGQKADVFSLAVVLFMFRMKKYPTQTIERVINSKEYKYFRENKKYPWPTDP